MQVVRDQDVVADGHGVHVLSSAPGSRQARPAGGGELAVLERRAHGGVLLFRDGAAEHQGLGAAADTAVQRTHEHLAGARVRDLCDTDLCTPGAATQPDRASWANTSPVDSFSVPVQPFVFTIHS